MPAADAAGDYKTIDSDAGENTDSDDDDDDGDDDSSNKDDDDDDDADDGIQSRDTDDSSDDANDSNGAEFSAAHQHLQGSFKTAEGITVTIVKGSIAAQKVCITSVHRWFAAQRYYVHKTFYEKITKIQKSYALLCGHTIFVLLTPAHTVTIIDKNHDILH